MPAIESAIYLKNGDWNTRQIREASSGLTYSAIDALDSLIPLMDHFDFDLGPLGVTRAVTEVFVPENIPVDKRRRWNNDELCVYKVLTFLSTDNTPGRLGSLFQETLERVDYFGSADEARTVWNSTRSRLNKLLSVTQRGGLDALRVALDSYKESRAIRFALAGQFFFPEEAITIVEN